MAGKFDGLSDREWELFADVFADPEPKPGPKGGRPRTPARKVLNTIGYVLITGCRWVDVPTGPDWAPRSTAHDWLQIWIKDGTFDLIRQRLLGIAQTRGLLDWEYGAIDGSFSPREGRRRRSGQRGQGQGSAHSPAH